MIAEGKLKAMYTSNYLRNEQFIYNSTSWIIVEDEHHMCSLFVAEFKQMIITNTCVVQHRACAHHYICIISYRPCCARER